MTASLQWIETLDLYGPTHVDGLNPDQSVELEKKMYEAALSSVKAGYLRLSQLKVPASRRPDYFAEMLKDDKQMTKVRSKLVVAQQKVDAVEARKKKQAQRKFAKQLRAAKIEKKKELKTAEKLSQTSAKTIDKKNSKNSKLQKDKKFSTRNLGRPKQKVALNQKKAGKAGKFGKSKEGKARMNKHGRK